MLRLLSHLIYPEKCLFCGKLLRRGETDLCPNCRQAAPDFQKAKNKHSFIARWTAVWYYKEEARGSILRYKFFRHYSYSKSFGRFLAMKLQTDGLDSFDVMTWVPVSRLRRLTRGFDQVELLAQQVGRELARPPRKVLVKIRNTPPQSTLASYAMRRANVLGAYRVKDPDAIRGKHILLLDDVITTGATASECARTLLSAGAREVTFAAIAAADYDRK